MFCATRSCGLCATWRKRLTRFPVSDDSTVATSGSRSARSYVSATALIDGRIIGWSTGSSTSSPNRNTLSLRPRRLSMYWSPDSIRPVVSPLPRGIVPPKRTTLPRRSKGLAGEIAPRFTGEKSTFVVTPDASQGGFVVVREEQAASLFEPHRPLGLCREPNCAILACYVAWVATRTGRLFFLRSLVTLEAPTELPFKARAR